MKNNDISLKDLILTVRDWYRYLLSRWLVILASVLIGSFAGFFYCMCKKPVYIASTTFVLEDEHRSGGLSSIAGLASMAGLDIDVGGGSIFQGDNILELYKSRKMIEKTLLTTVKSNGRNQLLVDQYISFNKLKEIWSKNPQLNDFSFTDLPLLSIPKARLKDSLMTAIISDINKNYLTVEKPDKKLSIISVNVKAIDEVFAKAFNDEIVKNVNDFYVQTKTKKSLENVKILQQKTDSVRAIMNGAIYVAANIVDATPNLNPTRQSQRTAPTQRAQFSAETNKAMLSSLVQNLEMSKISLRNDAPLIQVIDQPVFPLQKSQIGKIKGAGIGGFIAGFLVGLFLLIYKFFNNLLN